MHMSFRGTDQYDHYSGNRRSRGRILRVIFIVLAAALLALGLTIWGLQQYVIYDADGAHLVLPGRSYVAAEEPTVSASLSPDTSWVEEPEEDPSAS
jgi:hypothetical protein